MKKYPPSNASAGITATVLKNVLARPEGSVLNQGITA